MKDRQILLDAINNYDLYNNTEKSVLKTLIDISINNVAIVSVKKLTVLSKVSIPMVYKALATLEKDMVVKRVIHGTSKKSSFTINENKLYEITKHFKLHLEKNIYLK